MKNIPCFEEQRKELEKVYENAFYDPETGLAHEEIRKIFEQHCKEYPAEPYILTHAFLVRLLCEKARFFPEEDHLFAGIIEHKGIFHKLFQERSRKFWQEEFGEDGRHVKLDFENGYGYMVDVSHIAPDWKRVLLRGLPGLLQDVKAAPESDFTSACIMVLEGAIFLAKRMGKKAEYAPFDAIAQHAPETLHEAFLLTYFLHELIENGCVAIRSMGRFDRDFYPFYKHDLENGILTEQSAKELLKHYWMRFYAKHQGRAFGKNFCFGPQINALSFLGMETYAELDAVDPKLSVFLTKETPEKFLKLFAENIRNGKTGIVTLNYDMVLESMRKAGREEEDLEDVLPIGCYEPAIMGKEVSLSGATFLYFPCILLRLLKKHDSFVSFDSLLEHYLAELLLCCEEMAYMQSRCEKIWPLINPVPLLSATFTSCVEKGLDVTLGGAKYNTTGCVASHIADCVDSLAAMKKMIFDEKICTLPELKNALEANWKGYEKLQLYALKKCSKWGNNDEEADSIAVKICSFAADALAKQKNGRNGNITPSIYGQRVVESGEEISALPSGRIAGTPVSKNMDAVTGMDKKGVTSLMNSVLKIDMTLWPCGTCLDVMLHPSSVKGSEGLHALCSLIRTFIFRGGSGLQFNIFDAQMLKEAQKKPEKYENLQVRVCGWNSRFTILAREAQDTFIQQAEQLP